jgi:hypothetical protein
MKRQNKSNAIFIILIAVAIGLACGSAEQTEEANKMVEQANRKLDESKELYAKTEKRNRELFSAKITDLAQLDNYKRLKGDEAKSIADDYERVARMLKEVARQYDDISRLNLPEKYKDYAKLKSDEYAKRAEAVSARKGNAQAFREIDNPDTMLAKFDENNMKSDRLFKEAEDIAAKAKKVEEEHKEVFKQT